MCCMIKSLFVYFTFLWFLQFQQASNRMIPQSWPLAIPLTYFAIYYSLLNLSIVSTYREMVSTYRTTGCKQPDNFCPAATTTHCVVHTKLFCLSLDMSCFSALIYLNYLTPHLPISFLDVLWISFLRDFIQ